MLLASGRHLFFWFGGSYVTIGHSLFSPWTDHCNVELSSAWLCAPSHAFTTILQSQCAPFQRGPPPLPGHPRSLLGHPQMAVGRRDLTIFRLLSALGCLTATWSLLIHFRPPSPAYCTHFLHYKPLLCSLRVPNFNVDRPHSSPGALCFVFKTGD